MADYVIMLGKSFLASRVGWGPTFSDELTEAKKFNSVSDAYQYRRNNLCKFNCKIARIGIWFNPPTIIC